MPDESLSTSLLEQLDALQEHVLSELESLDQRIVGLIRDWTQAPRPQLVSAPAESDQQEAA